ncbi:hypothetical protein [Streptomyces sp. Je 1-369]|uniref:hypothetical protein n=1 Tax=Streptomyces sp. Je 1-369 TaxID=2966192 RepID=UPI0022866088|nr:hypothetical protein [Streptomyces sp. Je 1-369]WAL93644.1 hypothetical protein NOO62_03540 [Streptomyces sp. Je 1-369]
MAAASRSLDVLVLAHRADLAILRTVYDTAPAPEAPANTAPALPPAPSNSPPTGSAPSR